MSTKYDLLNKLSKDQLKEIAISEGFKVPEGATKDDIIKILLRLSMSRIKEVVSEYVEEVERTTIIKEKIKRKGRIEKRERTEITLSRAEMLVKLLENNVRLHPSLIEELGEKFRFHADTKGPLHNIYSKFPEDALRAVYECFIECKIDERGRYLEYRFAQWLAKTDKRINKIDIDKKIPNIGEIDVIGYDKKGRIIVIAECKARKSKASKEDIDPWLRNVELIFNETKGSLTDAYFINIMGFTDEIRKRMLEDKRIDERGFFKIKRSFVKIVEGDIVFGALEGVNIHLCEERSGEIKQIFP